MPEQIRMTGRVQEMAGNDVKARIGGDLYDAIKRDDPHPLFAVLTVAEEGVSAGKVNGKNKTKTWLGNVIEQIATMLQPFIGGTVQVYEGPHRTPGAPENFERKPIGKVISGFVEKVKDKLRAYGIIYVPPDREDVRKRIRDGELDVGSIDAEVMFSSDAQGGMIVEKVNSIWELVLGNSKVSKPGFAGAKIAAVVQENQAEGEGAKVSANLVDLLSNLQNKDVILGSEIVKKHVEEKAKELGKETAKMLAEKDAALNKLLEAAALKDKQLAELKPLAIKGQVDAALSAALKDKDEITAGLIRDGISGRDFSAAADLVKAVNDAAAAELVRIDAIKTKLGVAPAPAAPAGVNAPPATSTNDPLAGVISPEIVRA